ncbi:MAG: ketoacyl-ACP synthase III [Caulobacter sp.]
MLTARIKAIAGHLPEGRLTNDALAERFPDWSADKILEKTGIAERRIAAPGETSLDLAEGAARALLAQEALDPAEIDFLLLCTQTPDYVLPTSACLLQARLGLPTSAGALDFNLGCSGFVYGLSLAKGLIESGQARRVLLVTADTYTKLLAPDDQSVRTLFGDGAAATLVEAEEAEAPLIDPVIFGTDGQGGERLIVRRGGFREPSAGADMVLEMDGPGVMAFTLGHVPKAVEALLQRTGRTMEDHDLFVFHQANGFILDRLRRKLAIPPERFVIDMREVGNTVSSTIPLALAPLLKSAGAPRPAPRRAMLVGFGVGLSWAAASVVI